MSDIFPQFSVYSRLYKLNKNEKEVFIKKRCTLLDVCSKFYESDMQDRCMGLAAYMDEDAKKYVKFISYSSTADGYIEFFVKLHDEYRPSTEIELDGKKQTLKEYICNFISWQISDGWGENGIYVVEGGWIGGKAIHCWCTESLYEKDYKKSSELSYKATGIMLSDFDEFPAFKPVSFKDN